MGLQSDTPCPATSSSLLHRAKLLHCLRAASEPTWSDIDQGDYRPFIFAHQQVHTSLPAQPWGLICSEPVDSVLSKRCWAPTDPFNFLGFKDFCHQWELQNSWQALKEETLNAIYFSVTPLLRAAHSVRPHTGLMYNWWLKTTASFQKPSSTYLSALCSLTALRNYHPQYRRFHLTFCLKEGKTCLY